MVGNPKNDNLIMEFDWFLIYLIIGLFVGFLAGMLGIGGGTTLVPLLVFVFSAQNFNDEKILHLALGTTITTIIFTSIASIRAHHSRRVIRWEIVKIATPGLFFGTLIGTVIADILKTEHLAFFFVTFVYYVAFKLFTDSPNSPKRQLPGVFGITVGAILIGFISSLVGAGGGVISIPLMVLCNVPIIQAVGTSAALGFPISISGALGYVFNGLGETGLPPLTIGYVYLPALLAVVIGTILTVPLGARTAHSLPGHSLKKIFALVLFLLASRMAWKIFSSQD